MTTDPLVTKKAITVTEADSPNSLDRFISRLLRREIFTELSQQDHPADEPFKLVLFGSGVVQAHRPEEGYPIRRMARDIDIGFITKNKSADPPEAQCKKMGQYVLNAIGKSGAKVIDGSMKGRPGFDGLKIQKTYTRDEIEAHLKGRLEADDIKHYLEAHETFTTTLAVDKMVMRSPLLDTVPLGDKGFQMLDVREIAADKMDRLISNVPVTRDASDLYNLLHTDPPIIDIEAEKGLLRSLVVAKRFGNGHTARTSMIQGNDDVADMIFEKLFARSQEQYAWMPADRLEERIAKEKQTCHDISQATAALFKTVFPEREITADDFPPNLRGPLNFTRDEVTFGLNIKGVNHPKGAPAHIREMVIPSAQSGLIVPASVAQKHPELAANINQDHEIQDKIKARMSQNMMIDF